jgi:small conductance mechanosensitive channel
MDINTVWSYLPAVLNTVGRVVAAILIWTIGRRLANIATQQVKRALIAKKLDQTIVNYSLSALGLVMNIALVIVILSIFGFEMTSFSALVAAIGFAIGTAWAGLLAHFAAGLFLLVLRPFKIGDLITVAGINGKVTEMGMFSTTITTLDNVQAIIGNNKLFSDTIFNFSANAHRRVETNLIIPAGSNCEEAMDLIARNIRRVINVLETPAPVVEVLDLKSGNPTITVRVFCKPEHYLTVLYDCNWMLTKLQAEGKVPHVDPRNGVYHLYPASTPYSYQNNLNQQNSKNDKVQADTPMPRSATREIVLS